jgi:hypothetical protein
MKQRHGTKKRTYGTKYSKSKEQNIAKDGS